MTDPIFDTPWWLPVLIAGVGAVLFVTGNKRVEGKLRNAGLAVIALAMLLVAVSYFVDTPVETAVKRTKQFVAAFDTQDWATFGSIPDEHTLVSLHSLRLYLGRDQIVEAGKSGYQRYGFKSANVLTTSAERVDSTITVTITVLTTEGQIGRPINSEWQFEWQESAEGWGLAEIRALQIGQQRGEGMKGLFPNTR
jgi:predicted PurR-regulated permease PerM